KPTVLRKRAKIVARLKRCGSTDQSQTRLTGPQLNRFASSVQLVTCKVGVNANTGRRKEGRAAPVRSAPACNSWRRLRAGSLRMPGTQRIRARRVRNTRPV